MRHEPKVHFCKPKPGSTYTFEAKKDYSVQSWLNEPPETGNFFCGKKMKCFYSSNHVYLSESVMRCSELPTSDSWNFLTDLLCSNGTYVSDGRHVCASFMSQAFHFSRTIQIGVSPDRLSGSSVSGNCKQKQAIVNFLEYLSAKTAEHMPNSKEMHFQYPRQNKVYKIFVSVFMRCMELTLPL